MSAKKLLDKIARLVDQELYYEAQQLYDTLCSRLVGSNKVPAALHYTSTGALEFFTAGRPGNASEVAMLFAATLKDNKVEYSSDIVERSIQVFEAYPSEMVEAKCSFLKAIVQWSSKVGPNSNGDPELHYKLAQSLEETSPSTAHNHYLRSQHPFEHAEMIVRWSKAGFPSEQDLFLTRAVLEYLCLKDLQSANVLYTRTVQLLSLESPLVNFCKFLLQTIERDAKPLFIMLKDKYRSFLARDPNLDKLLTQIGEQYYGIRPQAGGLQGLLSNLMQPQRGASMQA